MNKKLFAELVESMTQMNEIVRGERAPSREFHVDAIAIKALRSKIGLSQPKFAALLHVNVGTLRNWEQGLREPTGPAKAAPPGNQPRSDARAESAGGGGVTGSVMTAYPAHLTIAVGSGRYR